MDNENEKEMTPEEAGKALSTWLPVDNISRIFMLCFFLIGFLGFFTSYEWLVWSFLITGFFSPRLQEWSEYGRHNSRIDVGSGE